MKGDIRLVLTDGEPRVDSRIIAVGLGIQHKSVVETVRRYQTDFEEFGVLPFKTEKVPKGRPEKLTLLNEDQAVFLLTLSRNTPKVVLLKKGLTRTFGKYRRHILQEVRQADIEWQETRQIGKEARRVETDIISLFVEYASCRDSKNANRYYKNITDMIYKELFLLDAATIKAGNIRDRLDPGQLSLLDVAEREVAHVLEKCMEAGMPYQDIYKAAKERVQALAAVVGRRKQ